MQIIQFLNKLSFHIIYNLTHANSHAFWSDFLSERGIYGIPGREHGVSRRLCPQGILFIQTSSVTGSNSEQEPQGTNQVGGTICIYL